MTAILRDFLHLWLGFFLFPLFAIALALLCGVIQYRISRRVRSWRLRVPALLPLPSLLGGLLCHFIRKNGFLLEHLDFDFDFCQAYLLAALLGAVFGWLLGLWFRED